MATESGIKKADLTKLFGSLPRKKSGQEFKDMVRKGWKDLDKFKLVK